MNIKALTKAALLEKWEYYLTDHILGNGIAKKVYRNSTNTYDQILIPTSKNRAKLEIVLRNSLEF